VAVAVPCPGKRTFKSDRNITSLCIAYSDSETAKSTPGKTDCMARRPAARRECRASAHGETCTAAHGETAALRLGESSSAAARPHGCRCGSTAARQNGRPVVAPHGCCAARRPHGEMAAHQ
jgi:hypothetical protein